MNASTTLINVSRQRILPKSYSWVDHRLVHEGHLKRLNPEAATMYLFLLTVGDNKGISYYSDRAVYARLAVTDLFAVRQQLEEAGLIAYCKPIYQVLSIPDSIGRVRTPAPVEAAVENPATAEEIAEITRQFLGADYGL